MLTDIIFKYGKKPKNGPFFYVIANKSDVEEEK